MADRKIQSLIIGAGDLGQRIAKKLSANGHEIFTINRNATKLPDHYTRIAYDVTSSNMQLDLPVIFDHVFITLAPDNHQHQDYTLTYLKSLENLKNILEKAKRVYFASSTGVYHQNNGEIVDESSPTEPTSFSGQTMLAAESWIRNNLDQSVTVRLSGLYSQERTRLFTKFQNSEEVKLDRMSNRIHLEDAASMFVFISRMKKPDWTYIASDSNPSLNWEIFHWLAKQTGQVFDKPKPEIIKNKTINNQKIIAEGFTFKYPSFKEGFAEIIKQ